MLYTSNAKLVALFNAKLVALFMQDLCHHLFEKNRTMEDIIRDANDDSLLAEIEEDEDEDGLAGATLAPSSTLSGDASP